MDLTEYLDPLTDPLPPNKPQIRKIIQKLSPYKALRPNGIPNIVLQKCYDLIANHLLYIYQAILEMEVFNPNPWHEFITVVLRKPDKPDYELPKAYRPITLISTMAKVLTALVGENISWLVKQHQLLPKTHFGGRPGRTTADSIHYLICKVKRACMVQRPGGLSTFPQCGGSFLNAVMDHLIHNLKKRRIPEVYMKFIKLLPHWQS